MEPSTSWSSKHRSFSRQHIFDSVQVVVFGLAVLCVLCCLVWLVRDYFSRKPRSAEYVLTTSDTSNQPRQAPYRPSAAWATAFCFFGVCFSISWGTGVLSATFFTPLAPVDGWEFYVFTSACFAVVVVGYWVVWPLGTVTYGRKRAIAWCLVFGVVDGLAESQLFLSFWAVVELINLPRWGTAVIVFFVQGGFKANWDQKFWNVYVAPEHNVQEWNKWKILFVHVPNVLVTFSYFVTYGCAPLYVATQTVALVGSTCAMAFPSPWSSYTNPPKDSWVHCYSDKARANRWRGDQWSPELFENSFSATS